MALQTQGSVIHLCTYALQQHETNHCPSNMATSDCLPACLPGPCRGNDDDDAGCPTNSRTVGAAGLTIAFQPGTYYFIAVGAFSSGSPPVSVFNISARPFPPPLPPPVPPSPPLPPSPPPRPSPPPPPRPPPPSPQPPPSPPPPPRPHSPRPLPPPRPPPPPRPRPPRPPPPPSPRPPPPARPRPPPPMRSATPPAGPQNPLTRPRPPPPKPRSRAPSAVPRPRPAPPPLLRRPRVLAVPAKPRQQVGMLLCAFAAAYAAARPSTALWQPQVPPSWVHGATTGLVATC